MELFDGMIERIGKLTEGMPCKAYSYDEQKIWPENADFEMIFQKDTAYELGGGRNKSVNLTCVTTTGEYFDGDQIAVYGPDLSELREVTDYARICEILVRGDGLQEGVTSGLYQGADGQSGTGKKNGAEQGSGAEQEILAKKRADETHRLLQDMEFVKFHIYPKGFMLRSSGQSSMETVRVGKKAMQEGITFERIGNLMISHYKKDPRVLAVRMIFVTNPDMDYEELERQAKKTVEIRNSLSRIQKGLPTECAVCEIREICSEVEGLRELHFGKKQS